MQFDAVKHLANAIDANDQANQLDPSPHNRAVREALLAIAASNVNVYNRLPAKTDPVGLTISRSPYA